MQRPAQDTDCNKDRQQTEMRGTEALPHERPKHLDEGAYHEAGRGSSDGGEHALQGIDALKQAPMHLDEERPAGQAAQGTSIQQHFISRIFPPILVGLAQASYGDKWPSQ